MRSIARQRPAHDDRRATLVPLHHGLGRGDGVERPREDRLGRRHVHALALLDVEHAVVPQERHLLVLPRLLVLHREPLPEHDHGGAFTLADVPAAFPGLAEGEPQRRVVALGHGGHGQQERVDPAVGPVADEVAGAAPREAGDDGVPPRGGPRLQRGEDAVGDFLVDVQRHGRLLGETHHDYNRTRGRSRGAGGDWVEKERTLPLGKHEEMKMKIALTPSCNDGLCFPRLEQTLRWKTSSASA